MRHRFHHGLGSRARARLVVERAYSEYRQELAAHHPCIEWSSEDRARVGFTVMGRSMWVGIEVHDDAIVLDGKLPLLFRPFEHRVIGLLEREVEQWVARARAGEI